MIDIRIATKDDIDCLMSIRLEMLTVVNNLCAPYRKKSPSYECLHKK